MQSFSCLTLSVLSRLLCCYYNHSELIKNRGDGRFEQEDDVSDYDTTSDDDLPDLDTEVDSSVSVTVEAGETESNLPNYPGDLSDYDTDPDQDPADSNNARMDNVIGVSIKPGEKDEGNNFADTDNGSFSGSVTDDNGKPDFDGTAICMR